LKYILFILLFASNLFFQHKEYSPTVADYEEKIDYFEKVSINLFDQKTWEQIILKNKYEDKEIRFSQMNEYHKGLFRFSMGNRTLNSYLKIEDYWKEELKKFDNPNHKLVNSKESRPATKTEVKSYLDKLQIMRKKFASDFDLFTQDFFGKYKMNLTEEEIKSYNYKIQNAKK